MKRNSILIILLLLFGVVIGQTDQDHALAQQYYSNGEYEKAAELYEKLWDKNPGNTFYYSSLFRTLLSLKDYDALEKVIKKQSKRDKNNPKYLVDMGYVYKQRGELNEGEKSYDDALKSMSADERLIRSLANTFNSFREDEYVVLTYEKGAELLNNRLVFSFELANAYQNAGKDAKAVENYLFAIEKNQNQLQRVKNNIQNSKAKKALFNELETQLYKKIQRNPDRDVYPDLLIWLYVQRKDFESALIQAKAIDRRKKENGMRVYRLAKAALTEKNYESAIDAYEYILDKGKANDLYVTAKRELLNCRKERLENNVDYTVQDVNFLRKEYLSFLDENGKNPATASTIRELAQLEAFYSHDLDAAIGILEELIAMPSLPGKIKSMCKLDLGDYYVLKGDVWEATLLYAQVDKSEKDSPIGEDARFRNAKLSYYKGEFEWAQAQLNILKASTTELIANDALNLSIFIMDNLGLDTVLLPMEMFSRAELLMFQNRDDDAIEVLDSINLYFPGHNLTDDILFAKAKIHFRKKDFPKTQEFLENVINIYGDDLLADDATFMLAEMHEKQFGDTEKAMELYKDIIINFKDSVLVVEARKRFRSLRGDFVVPEQFN
ncbi:MAG: tetratricopeptide repeat protein [Chitinophagales bacterium]|nr:tetratricopeptide repeat protein [Chitinophagales bacterium]